MFENHPNNFDRYADYYGLFNQEKDYLAEVEYLEKLISRHTTKAKSILELGAGTGGHAMILNKKGYKVVGIERSPKMAAIAIENGVECVIGDISRVELEAQFDAVLSLFHVISYLTATEDLERTFKLAFRHTKPGGVFIFDVWYTEAVEFQKPEPREKLVSYKGVNVRRSAIPVVHPEDKVVDVEYEFAVHDADGQLLDQWAETHPMRHFSTQEIQGLSHKSGFELVGSEEYLTGAVPSESTWGVCYILRKNNK